jgi:hypothetical protein
MYLMNNLQGHAGSHYNSAVDDDEYINTSNNNHNIHIGAGNSSTLSDSPRSAYPDSLSDTLLDEEGNEHN